jgi:phospholipase/carboxylesterase
MEHSWGEAAGLRYVQLEPQGAGPDCPLIVAVHGRGADATDLAGLAFAFQEPSTAGGAATPGYRWVLPQAPLPVSLGLGAVGWAWYELGDAAADTLAPSRDMLQAFVEAMLEQFGTRRERTVLMGFSQGAAMTLHAGLGTSAALGALVVMSGHLPAEHLLLPLLNRRTDQHILLVHGTQDATLPIERGRHVKQVLEEYGLRPEYHEFPMGHEISVESLRTVRDYVLRTIALAGS